MKKSDSVFAKLVNQLIFQERVDGTLENSLALKISDTHHYHHLSRVQNS